MILALLALVLAQPVANGQDYCYRVSRAGHDCDFRSSQRTGAPFFALCDAIQAGDKAGAWECMKGDGTMASGSATTFVATGSPTNTTENGWPVRTYAALSNDHEPANVAFPSSDFSVCKHHRSVDLAATCELAAFGPTTTPGNTTTLPFEQAIGTGSLTSYISDGVGYTGTAPPGTIVTGTWYLLCFTYQRVGGAANNVGNQYVNGTLIGSSNVMGLANTTGAGEWSTNGGQTGVLAPAGSTRGFFVTYKVLSATDIARIYQAVGP